MQLRVCLAKQRHKESETEVSEVGLQGTWFDEVSDNVARFDEAGNPITRDDWIQGIFQVGNVEEDAIETTEDAIETLINIGKLTASREVLKASDEYTDAVRELGEGIVSELLPVIDKLNDIIIWMQNKISKLGKATSGKDDS